MMYALIDNNRVANIILADAQHAEQVGAVACPDGVGVGWLYDGQSFTAPRSAGTITHYQFRQLMTDGEVDAWRALREEAAAVAPNLRTGTQKAQLRAYDDFQLAQSINLGSPETIGALFALTSWGVLTEARADAISRGEAPG